MARSFSSVIVRSIREAERHRRAVERENVRRAREQSRLAAAAGKYERQQYVASRVKEVDDLNRELEERLNFLEQVLLSACEKPACVDFDAKLVSVEREVGAYKARNPLPGKPQRADFTVPPLSFLASCFPWRRQEQAAAVERANADFAQAIESFDAALRSQERSLERIRNSIDAQNEQINRRRAAFLSGDAETIAAEVAETAEEHLRDLVSKVEIEYLRESRLLAMDVESLDVNDIVPIVERYNYVKASDEIREKRLSEKQVAKYYSDYLFKLALRSLSMLVSATSANIVETSCVSVFLPTIDRATGRPVRPCLISVRATRDQLAKINFRKVDPAACLKQLNAAVSRSPTELLAVKPIMQLNMHDPRFIGKEDVLGMLDTRPNLMELTPSEFESLITNLFEKMGLETRLTQASRDGGVDCVAFDARPVLGGKVVIQAKRYKNTVGVGAVRDLFGTMHNEGASKGILVTTSGYGKAAFEFANGKPLELIDGSNLLYLLHEHAGIAAKIIVPDDWADLAADR